MLPQGDGMFQVTSEANAFCRQPVRYVRPKQVTDKETRLIADRPSKAVVRFWCPGTTKSANLSTINFQERRSVKATEGCSQTSVSI